jgi:hypothetical protein
MSGPHSAPDPYSSPGDQLLVDLLEAATHGVEVEDYIACHNSGASHQEILEAHAKDALTGYAGYRALGACHVELLDSKRVTIDLTEIITTLGVSGLVRDTTIKVDQNTQDHSYQIGRSLGLSHDQMLAIHRASVYFIGDDPPQLTLTATTHAVLGGAVSNIHSPLDCAGEFCCVHNPSEHHMLTWPQVWNQSKHVMERQCPHGNTHPDPDDPATATIGGNIHPCDGCCIQPQ